jgi:hypothetical protein
VLKWPQKIFAKYFQYGLKSIKKVYTKKVRWLRTFVHSTKRWKSTLFLHFDANNYFVWIFLHFFQRIWNQRPILRFFLDTHIKICNKYLWGHTSTFYQLWILMHTKRPKKRKFVFFKCESELTIIFNSGFWPTKIISP